MRLQKISLLEQGILPIFSASDRSSSKLPMSGLLQKILYRATHIWETKSDPEDEKISEKFLDLISEFFGRRIFQQRTKVFFGKSVSVAAIR